LEKNGLRLPWIVGLGHSQLIWKRLFCLVAVLAPAVHADPTALHDWLKRQASIQSLQADFTQERKLPSLKEPVSTPGKFAFSKPGRIRWQLGVPAATLVVSNGSEILLIDHSTKTARRVKADSPQAARYSMLSGKGFQSIEDFHALFEVTAHRVESGIHQYTLKPKERRMRSQVPWVFLDIDPAKTELRAMEMELQDKSRIRTLFHKPVFDGKLSPTLFEADLSGLTIK
jgi:outer membrane lipoprotein-sorting protein